MKHTAVSLIGFAKVPTLGPWLQLQLQPQPRCATDLHSRYNYYKLYFQMVHRFLRLEEFRSAARCLGYLQDVDVTLVGNKRRRSVQSSGYTAD